MENHAILKIRNVSKTYPGVKALQNVNFDVLQGEVHALVGANGAGKSTLIKILGGIIQPDKGAQLEIGGKTLSGFTKKESAQYGISIIYQDLSLFPNLTVFENIVIETITDTVGVIPWKTLRGRAQNALDTIASDIDLNELVCNLPMAKQQLVAIARCLARDAKLVIMDEPTSALSKGEIEELLKIIINLKEKGLSIMFVSHKLEELLQVCDNFSTLKDGCYLGTLPREQVDKDVLIRQMIGQSVQMYMEPKAIAEEVVLSVENLSKRGNFKDISFDLHKGELLGITGIVGAGRTELAEAIFGLKPADSGKIFIGGQEVSIGTPADAIRKKLAYLPENRQLHGLLLEKSLMDNIAVVNSNLMKNKLGLIDSAKKRSIAKEWIQKLKITPHFEDMNAKQLSGGNQQRVVLAKWLCSQPDIFIVDEPTNGVDIGAKKEIYDLLRNLAKEGISIIIISSELDEVFNNCDRIMVMRQGKISAIVKTEETDHEFVMSRAVLETADAQSTITQAKEVGA